MRLQCLEDLLFRDFSIVWHGAISQLTSGVRGAGPLTSSMKQKPESGVLCTPRVKPCGPLHVPPISGVLITAQGRVRSSLPMFYSRAQNTSPLWNRRPFRNTHRPYACSGPAFR